MKNIYKLILVPLITLLFSACGDEGEGKFDTGTTQINITNCETYITLQEGDLLVKDNDNTSIKIIHNINNTKQVCVRTGSAHLIRKAN